MFEDFSLSVCSFVYTDRFIDVGFRSTKIKDQRSNQTTVKKPTLSLKPLVKEKSNPATVITAQRKLRFPTNLLSFPYKKFQQNRDSDIFALVQDCLLVVYLKHDTMTPPSEANDPREPHSVRAQLTINTCLLLSSA